MADDRRRPDHDRGDPQRAQLGRRRDERDADPLGLHLDHLRAEGLLGRAARRRAPRARPVGRAADLPRQPRGLHRRDRGDVRPRGLAAGRRLDHERLLPRRHAPERHHRLRADLPRRRARRLRRLARPLARRRRQGCRRADGLDRDLPGGPPARADEGRRGRPRAPRHRRPARAQLALLLSGGRRPERPDRLRAHRRAPARGAASSGSAPRRSRRRATRSSRRPSGSSGSRSARSPTASTRPRARSTTTGSRTTPVAVRVRIEISGGDMTIDLREHRRRGARARSTAARRRRSPPAASPTSCSSHPTCRRTAARSRRSRCEVRRGSVVGRDRALAVRLVLQPARAPDRPGRQGAQPGAAAEGGRGELRRLDDRRRARASTSAPARASSTSSRRSAAGAPGRGPTARAA